MFMQTNSAPKLHSIHALPDGSAFTGKLAPRLQFTFAPKSAVVAGGKLTLIGEVTVKSPAGTKRATHIAATLAATQGSIQPPPPAPHDLPDALKPAFTPPATDATGPMSSIGVLYLRLAPMDGHALGVPMDLGAVQLNARLYPQSRLERDLQWLYSAWLLAAHEGKNTLAGGYLGEINRRLKA
jgi:hypothetical protein